MIMLPNHDVCIDNRNHWFDYNTRIRFDTNKAIILSCFKEATKLVAEMVAEIAALGSVKPEDKEVCTRRYPVILVPYPSKDKKYIVIDGNHYLKHAAEHNEIVGVVIFTTEEAAECIPDELERQVYIKLCELL